MRGSGKSGPNLRPPGAARHPRSPSVPLSRTQILDVRPRIRRCVGRCLTARCRFRMSAVDESSADGPVLIVDDDPDIREVLAEALVDLGFEVVTAVHGRDALKLLQRMAIRPSAILLDLMMPVMDGYGFLEERTKDIALRSIPLAIVTAGHGIDHVRIGDGTPIVRKPF